MSQGPRHGWHVTSDFLENCIGFDQDRRSAHTEIYERASFSAAC
jgi:hypothetical protein